MACYRGHCGLLQRSLWPVTEIIVACYRDHCGLLQRSLRPVTEGIVACYREHCGLLQRALRPVTEGIVARNIYVTCNWNCRIVSMTIVSAACIRPMLTTAGVTYIKGRVYNGSGCTLTVMSCDFK